MGNNNTNSPKKSKLKLARDYRNKTRSIKTITTECYENSSNRVGEFLPHKDFAVKRSSRVKPSNPYNKGQTTSKKKPINPYAIKTNTYKEWTIKGIRKCGSNSNWHLTNKHGRSLNYSFNFNGPLEDGDELILIRVIRHKRRVSWGKNEIICYKPPEEYDPWEYVHKADSLIRILEPRKF